MQKLDVELKRSELNTGIELSDNFYRNCCFCEKFVKITPLNFNSCSNIGGNQYCPFCLRHNFHYKNNHNILIFSFRGIFGYYYYRLYKCNPHKMWVSQIESLIERHALIGLHNPVLVYDPFTYLWFADFNKIGTDKHKAPFSEVQDTIRRMFEILDVKTNLSPNAETSLLDRFQKATKLFYEQRKRPKERKMLIPTLAKILPSDTDEFYEQTRVFTKSVMNIK
jgi:hypothetical protein